MRWERSGARPQNWLGIIRGHSTELRIVPKGWSSVDHEMQGRVQLVLLGLLAQSNGIRLTLTGLGTVRPEPTLLELLYRLFIDACRLALRRRAIRTYKKIVESGPQMRGSLMFPDQALVRLVDPASFVTSRTELTWDNPFNRVLAAACDQIVRCRREDLRAAAQVLAASLHASPIPSRVSSDRAAARRMRVQSEHTVCLQLAELVLDVAGGAGLFAGDLDLGAQLVSTWRLVADWHSRHRAPAHTWRSESRSQPAGNFALRRISGAGPREVLELRPDLLASIPSRAVLDTKWKLTDASNLILDPSDLHQALDYARHFQVSRVVLLYPGFGSTRTDQLSPRGKLPQNRKSW